MGTTASSGSFCKLVIVAAASAALLAGLTPAFAQTSPPPATSSSSEAKAMPTSSGDTGLWLVPTAQTLARKTWSVSFLGVNADYGQGFTDVQRFPVTFGVGLGHGVEVFGNWSTVVRIDRDTRPLFFDSTAAEQATGTGGGIVPDYPLVRGMWSGNRMGDAWIGAKVRVFSASDGRVGLAARAQVKLPVGDDTIGTSSGKADVQIDGVVSSRISAVELSGFGGMIVRGNPTGYTLTNGVTWGVGAGFRLHPSLLMTAEFVGEHYLTNPIVAPAGLLGDDGSTVPVQSFQKDPALLNVGLTWHAANGFFIGGGGSWNVNMKARSLAEGTGTLGFFNVAADKGGFIARIGYAPGSKATRTAGSAATAAAARPATPPPTPPTAASSTAAATAAATTPPPAPPAPTPPPAPPRPANRPPVARAMCDPCRIEVGRSLTVSVDAQDADGDALTFQWKAPTGTLASATSRQSRWTAPQEPGRADISVTVSDGKGGVAESSVSIEVVKAREYQFGDVQFDFDKSVLRPDAIVTLNKVVAAMRDDPGITLVLEGNTCNIGSTKYNQALGERRAKAVRDYLIKMNIAASRLETVSYGEERPKYDNARELTRKMNRRTVLVVRLQFPGLE